MEPLLDFLQHSLALWMKQIFHAYDELTRRLPVRTLLTLDYDTGIQVRTILAEAEQHQRSNGRFAPKAAHCRERADHHDLPDRQIGAISVVVGGLQRVREAKNDLHQNADFLKRLRLIWAVQSRAQK